MWIAFRKSQRLILDNYCCGWRTTFAMVYRFNQCIYIVKIVISFRVTEKEDKEDPDEVLIAEEKDE